MKIFKREADYFLAADPKLARYVTRNGEMRVRVKKALYGLAQSPKLWYEHLARSLKTLGYAPTDEDRCAFINNTPEGVHWILTHVDDMLILTSSMDEVARLKLALEAIYPEMKYQEGDSLKYLGMELSRDRARRTIVMSLRQYTREILKEYGISESRPCPSVKQLIQEAPEAPVDVTKYLSLLMKVMYLAKRTRPDILFVCSYLATHAKAPMELHWKRLNHVLMYLHATADLGLVLSASSTQLQVYADASYLIHPDAKSHSGISVHVGAGGGSILASSKKQKIVSTSSTEAELIAQFEAVRLVVWLQSLIRSLGVESQPPVIFQDNQAAIHLARGGKPTSGGGKFMLMRVFKTREYIEDGSVVLEYKPTEDMIADILTKPLVGGLFKVLAERILGLHGKPRPLAPV
jgi:hypothetical protein